VCLRTSHTESTCAQCCHAYLAKKGNYARVHAREGTLQLLPIPFTCLRLVRATRTYCADTYCAGTYCADTYCADTYCADTYCADTYCAGTYCAGTYCADTYCADTYCADTYCAGTYCAETYGADTAILTAGPLFTICTMRTHIISGMCHTVIWDVQHGENELNTIRRTAQPCIQILYSFDTLCTPHYDAREVSFLLTQEGCSS